MNGTKPFPRALREQLIARAAEVAPLEAIWGVGTGWYCLRWVESCQVFTGAWT